MSIARKITLIGLAGFMALTGVFPFAEQQAEAAAAPKACNLKTSLLLNKPKGVGGTAAQQHVYTNKLVCAINAVPAGQPIYISTYNLDATPVVNALIAAHNRGVAVRIAVWNERANVYETQRLIKILGTNVAARSYVKVCLGSCLKTGADTGRQHAKAVAIPKLLGPKGKWLTNVTFIGSANPTYSNTEHSWNSVRLIVGNAKIYKAMQKYVYAMRLDRTQKLPAKVTSGSYTVYFSPAKLKDDIILKTLKATTCKSPKGYGAKGKTIIHITMYEWSPGRMAVATRLAKLKKQGCDIRIMLNDFRNHNHQVMVPLLQKAGIPVEDARVDVNGDGKSEIWTHDKVLLISGKVSGKGRTMTFMGSRNWTNNSVDTNTELLVLDRQKATLKTMLKWWNYELAKTQELKRRAL